MSELATLLLAVLVAGCSGGRWPALTSRELVVQRLDRADALARMGRYPDAREAYASVLPESGAPVDGDRALLGLARLALAPENPGRDEREATRYLDRLLRDYPQSAWAIEARTWRNLFEKLERLKGDVRLQRQDLERLRRDLQREQQKTARLRQEREHLRQIDLEYERPKSVMPITAPFLLKMPRE